MNDFLILGSVIVLIFGFIWLINYCSNQYARQRCLRQLKIGDKIYSCKFDGGGTFKTGNIIRDSIRAHEITHFEFQGLIFKRIYKIYTSGGEFFASDYMQKGYTFWRAKEIDLFLDELEEQYLLEEGNYLDNLQIIKDGIILVKKDAHNREDEELEERCDDLIQNINLKIKKP